MPNQSRKQTEYSFLPLAGNSFEIRTGSVGSKEEFFGLPAYLVKNNIKALCVGWQCL